jgi:lipopolysaccharide biosynthesis glycosyltransferase
MDLSEKNPNFLPLSKHQIECLEKIYLSTNSQSNIIYLDVKDIFLKELQFSPNNKSQYTPYAMLRLLADKIDTIPDKIIYLDADIMANGNISELYNIDISDYEIAGARDYYGKIFFNPQYLNSGVLLMNMTKIRESNMLSRALKLCNTRRIFLPDQTAINKCASKKKILSSRFNEQKKMKDNTLIRHFSTTLKFFPTFRKQNIKPWQIDDVHKVLKTYDFDDTFDKYLQIKKEYELI